MADSARRVEPGSRRFALAGRPFGHTIDEPMIPAGKLIKVLMRVMAMGIALPLVARADAVDDRIAKLMESRGVPGVSIAVFDAGAIVKARGYGVVEAGLSEPVSIGTLFQAGSVSKPVAAVGALRLVEDGRLTLDGDVNAHLKAWKVPENELTREEKVTLRRILSHSAGLTVKGFPGYASERVAAGVLQILDGAPPANTQPVRVEAVPGSRTMYSGGGYLVMQQMAAEAAGVPFSAYMRSRVLAPLGMSASTFEQPLPAMLAGRAASGHRLGRVPRVLEGRWFVHPELAAAGLWTTPTDLAKFAMAVQDAQAGGAGAILGKEVAGEMLTRQSGTQGLGWVIAGDGPLKRFEHRGRNAGFDTQLVAYVSGGRGAVVMMNANENAGMMARILEAIAEQYSWPGYPVRKPAVAIEDDAPQVSAVLRRVIERFADGGALDDIATAKLTGEVAPHRARIREDFLEYGALKKIERVQAAKDDGPGVHRHRLTFERATMLVRSEISDGRIDSISARPE